MSSGCRGHVGGEDVAGVSVEVLARSVVAHGAAWVGVPCSSRDHVRDSPGRRSASQLASEVALAQIFIVMARFV
jgi:hypothetical protein